MARDCSKLLSVAVHELRSPLAVVAGYLQMFVRGDLGPVSPRQKATLEDLHRASGRLVKLVDALRDLANLQAGSFVMNRRPAVLGDIAGEAARQAGREADRAAIVELPSPFAAAPVLADPARLSPALAVVFGGVLGSGAPGERLLVAPCGRPGRSVAFAAGLEPAARALTRAAATRLARFAPAGGHALETLVAVGVIEAHEGRVRTLRSEHPPRAVLIELPRHRRTSRVRP